MKKIIIGIVSLAFLFVSMSSRAETRPDFGLQPINNELTAMFNDAYVLAVTQDREYLLTSFLTENSKKFKQSDLLQIRYMMDEMPDNTLAVVSSTNYKDPTTMFIVSILVGGLGVDRFMLGQTGLGILKLVTAGGLGIWWLVDLCIISNLTKDHNFTTFKEAYQNSKLFLPPRG